MAAQTGIKRTIVIEPLVGEDGRLVTQRAEAEQAVLDELGALWAHGGVVRIVSDRVLLGKLPPAEPGGFEEPLGQTVGLVIEYTSKVPMHGDSVTHSLMDHVLAGDDAPAAAEPGPPVPEPSLAAAMAEGLGGDDEDEDEDGDGDESPDEEE